MKRMIDGRTDDSPAVPRLLASLNSQVADAAWQEFLDRFSSQVWRIVCQGTGNPDHRHDCFLYIFEKLSDHRFRRLRKYRPEGTASFRSWLEVVVANLCIDWNRAQTGRPRPFRNILNLRPLEQRVFFFRFQKQFGINDCLVALRPEFPGLSKPALTEAICHVQSVLTPQQRWLLTISNAKLLSLDSAEAPEQPASNIDPYDQAAKSQDLTRLEKALSCLQPNQRQLLIMRYRQELTLQEIARLTRLGDPFRVRRQIQLALDELARLLTT